MTKKSIKKKNGRPSAYNEEISARICSLIMDGHSLRSICAGQDMPSIRILYRWLHERREFTHQYATARETAGDEFAYQVLKIAEQTNEKNYKAVRIRIDGMKWLASKMSPKHWGDKHAITHTGAPSHHEVKKIEWVYWRIDKLHALHAFFISWRGIHKPHISHFIQRPSIAVKQGKRSIKKRGFCHQYARACEGI